MPGATWIVSPALAALTAALIVLYWLVPFWFTVRVAADATWHEAAIAKRPSVPDHLVNWQFPRDLPSFSFKQHTFSISCKCHLIRGAQSAYLCVYERHTNRNERFPDHFNR